MSRRVPSRRKQQLVDRTSRLRVYQVRSVTTLLLMVLVIGAASAFLALALIWNKLRVQQLEYQTSVVIAMVAVAFTLVVELLLAIPIVYYLGIRHSHRVVGPIRRMLQALEAIGAGEFSHRMAIRRNDVLGELAQAINRMAERLQQRRSQS